MVRVSIIADSLARAQSLADLLAEEERLEVVETAAPPLGNWPQTSFVDVFIVAGPTTTQLPPVESNVVFLTDYEPAALEAQGRAWLPLDISAGELIAAVLAAAEDLTVLTPAQWRRHSSGVRGYDPERSNFVEPLTKRELQVLRMLANGLGNKEIAGQLGISSHTAKFHVAQILAKLGASSRTEAVTTAIRRGLAPI